MKELIDAAHEVEAVLAKTQTAWCLIGGMANLRWGRNRLTRDVDLTVLASLETEREFVGSLLGQFRARRPDAQDFALRYRVVLMSSSEGVGIDLSLGAIPFEVDMVRRATPFDFGDGRPLPTCSAEDLVVMKAFAARTQDWADVEGIVLRQEKSLDTKAILKRLAPLAEAKDAPEILERTRRLFSSA